MTPEPTHDADRDISRATTGRSNYNLTAGEDIDVVVTNPKRRAGHGDLERELPDNIGPSSTSLVLARSGNQSWDEDEYDAVGGVEDEGSEELDIACMGEVRGEDPGIPWAKGLAIAAAVIGIYMLIQEKRRG
jgi:hypothetical protein